MLMSRIIMVVNRPCGIKPPRTSAGLRLSMAREPTCSWQYGQTRSLSVMNARQCGHIRRESTRAIVEAKSKKGDRRFQPPSLVGSPLLRAEEKASVPFLQTRDNRGDQHAKDRAGQRRRHIVLRIPDVALRSQPGIAKSGADDLGEPGLHDFVHGAERQDYVQGQIIGPKTLRFDDAQEDFAGWIGQHEAKGEVHQPVIMVAALVKSYLDPFA